MRPKSETQLDEQWERLEEEAERLTEQNRIELQAKAQKDRETAIEAMEAYLENVHLRDVAILLWDERKDELSDLNRSIIPGQLYHTELARWFSAAAEQYARDNAEKVYAQTLLNAEQDSAADAAIDDAQQGE